MNNVCLQQTSFRRRVSASRVILNAFTTKLLYFVLWRKHFGMFWIQTFQIAQDVDYRWFFLDNKVQGQYVDKSISLLEN